MVTPIPNARQQCYWLPFASIGDLEQAALRGILEIAHEAITRKGSFQIVLAGGTTPRNVYRLLRDADAEWGRWHVYFGDERCLPPEHVERNSLMARQAWLDHVPIPAHQIHVMRAELGAEQAARDYAAALAGLPEFDLVLLGLGEDGHTASLFPGHAWGTQADAAAVLAVHNAPKPPPDRVTLSARRLGLARHVLFLVTGESKRQAMRDWRNGANIPAAAITPANGVSIYLETTLLD